MKNPSSASKHEDGVYSLKNGHANSTTLKTNKK